jgi:hypothetical protein
MKKLTALVLVLFLAAIGLGASTVESLNLHIFLKGLDHPIPPTVREETLILTMGGVHRFVGAAFAHEGFATIHPFKRNEHGIFLLTMEVPLEFASPLAYRLIVDGAWMADPANSRGTTIGEWGLPVSLVDLPWRSSEEPGFYHVLGEDGKTARFLFKAPPGEFVTVAGSFNNWDPFTHALAETRPGEYRLDLPLPAGINLYCFVWRGSMIPDPLNEEKASNRYERVVSVLRVGTRPVQGDPIIKKPVFAAPGGKKE